MLDSYVRITGIYEMDKYGFFLIEVAIVDSLYLYVVRIVRVALCDFCSADGLSKAPKPNKMPEHSYSYVNRAAR